MCGTNNKIVRKGIIQLKILQIYKDFYPPTIGGIEKHINMLTKGLLKAGYDVEVLVSNTANKYETLFVDGVKITKAPQIFRCASAPINPNLSSILKRLSFDANLIHFHLPNPTAVVSYLVSGIKKPIIATYHSDIVRQVKLNTIYKPFQNIFLNKIDKIIATSQNYIDSSCVLNKYQKKCCVIPLGIEISKYEYNNKEKIKRIHQKYGERIILFIGKFRYYKGLNILIEAMSKVDGRLIIIGDGPIKNQVLNFVKEKKMQNNISILGEVDDEELKIYLNACSVFVLPSILRSEAFGLVLAEAMACEKPVISTELETGTSFVNQHQKTGLVIEPNNSSYLAEAINTLLDNKQKSAQFGKNGRERICEEFTCEKMIERTISVYKEIYNSYLQKNTIVYTSNKNERNKTTLIKIKKNNLKEKIKVVRIISRINIGGPSIHIKILSEKLNKKKYDTKLIIGSLSKHEGDMKYLLNSTKTRIYTVQYLQRDINLIKDFLAFLYILIIINRENPDIIHTHMAKAGVLGRAAAFFCNLFLRKKIKIVHTFHGNIFYGYFGPYFTKFFIIIERIMAKSTHAIIAISQTQKYELVEKYKITNSKKIYTINLGFDLNPFIGIKEIKSKLRKKYNINEKCILIGIVGRLVRVKNHFLFLDAARNLLENNKNDNIKFIIVGDGELNKELVNYAKKLKIKENVIFHGWEKDICNIYSIIDILVLTSLNEGTPVSIIEAMASSVPVITTGVGGVKDLLGLIKFKDVKNRYNICERGILCDIGDSIAISNAIEYLIFQNNSLRIKRAKAYVINNYTLDVLIPRIEKLYENLIKY